MNYKILLIDDNLELAENISDLLLLAHYDVINAANGKVGVEFAHQYHPDLVLCDIMMPELDGYGVFSALSEDPATATIPFIFLTAKSEAYDVRVGMNLGVDDYITKPFDIVDLLRVIQTRLKKSELMRSTFGGSMFDNTAMLNGSKEQNGFRGLQENRTMRSYKRRDLLFMEGQIPNDLYYIVEGRVKTYKVNFDGKELITGLYGAGDFFGYTALLEDKPYNEQAEVLADVKIAIIPKTDFFVSVYSNKEMARKFIRLISGDIEEMGNRLLEVAYQSVRQRVASMLLRISEKFVQLNHDEIITIFGKDISEVVGIARASLNRVMVDFKKEGLIKPMGTGYKIINKAKLKKILR